MDTAKVAALLRALELGGLSAAAEQLGYTLSRLMAAFSNRHPRIHIGLLEGMSTELAQKVERREADFL